MHADDDLIVSHLALNCGEDHHVRQLMKRLREHGVPYRENISVPNPATNTQVVQAFVRDPDGYYLEFCSCESLEDFFQEKMNLQENKLNLKEVLIAKSRIIELLNLDQTMAKENYKQSLKRWRNAKIIKRYGGDTCKDVSESKIASIALKFPSPGSILSIIREKDNNPLYGNILKNYNTEHINLIFAASQGNLETLRQGFHEGMDINYEDSCGRTCLHVAAENGYLDCVTFLVEECLVDPTVKDYRGLTAIKCAESGNNNDVVDFLNPIQGGGAKTPSGTFFV